jgi:tocopherol O-methyltransferase
METKAGCSTGGPLSTVKAHRSVAELYESKTLAILRRYGAGPRVHYHTGFVDAPPARGIEAIRKQLSESQERMLRYASDVWNFSRMNFSHLLDVGCGLGGSALFWAQEFGTRVTAITIVPSHVTLVAEMARRAGVESYVSPRLCDAASVPGSSYFDAAIALESSSLFARGPWFRCLARILPSEGQVFISDCFLGRPEYAEGFNKHWCGQIGSKAEYVDTAKRWGFELAACEDVSLRTATFWRTTQALIEAERSLEVDAPLATPLAGESLRTHRLMEQGLLDKGLQQLLLTFIKR